jgi:hypothetical protein
MPGRARKPAAPLKPAKGRPRKAPQHCSQAPIFAPRPTPPETPSGPDRRILAPNER